MPHEFESGFFTEGRPAWHGLGVTLPNDALDSVEAMEYSGLGGWNLTKQPTFVGNREDGYRQVRDRYAVVRAKATQPAPAAARPGNEELRGAPRRVTDPCFER
jgi:hypothetical protein